MAYINPNTLAAQFGVPNYIQNPNFETIDTFTARVAGADKWNAYKDAAQATPVDGTGGSPTVINNAVITAGKLRGTRSWQLSKTGNAQGEGYSQDFTIDAADASQTMSLSFDFSAGSAYTAGDLVVYIYDITNSTLITPTLTALPAGSGTFQCQWASITSTSYRVIFHCAASHTTTTNWTMTIDNIQMAPRNLVVGPAVGGWQTWTPTGSWTSNVTYTGMWRRVGDSAEILVSLVLTGTPSPSVELTLNLPPGLLIDSTKTPDLSYAQVFGTGNIRDGGVGNYPANVISAGTTDKVKIGFHGTGNIGFVNPSNPISFGSTDSINVIFTVPIANWSSNITFANNQTEYAWNSDTSGSDNYTSFGYGPSGVLMPNRSVGTAVIKLVRFSTPIQPTDVLTLEIYDPAEKKWMPQVTSIFAYVAQATNRYGCCLATYSASTTDVPVYFGAGGAMASGATYGANASAGMHWGDYYTAGWRWRVRKSAGPNALQLSGSIIGISDGSNALAGYVGEYVESTFVNISVGASAQWVDATSLSLSAGDWTVSFQVCVDDEGATFTSDVLELAISLYSGNNTTDRVVGNSTMDAPIAGANKEASGTIFRRLNLSTPTTVYAKTYVVYSSGTPKRWGKLWARRTR